MSKKISCQKHWELKKNLGPNWIDFFFVFRSKKIQIKLLKKDQVKKFGVQKILGSTKFDSWTWCLTILSPGQNFVVLLWQLQGLQFFQMRVRGGQESIQEEVTFRNIFKN